MLLRNVWKGLTTGKIFPRNRSFNCPIDNCCTVMKYFLSAVLFLLLTTVAVGQEFNCQVRVNVQKLTTVDPKVFATLEQSLSELMNNTKWTDDYFQTEERINCNVLLTIQEEESPTSFKADLAIQASRPVFNSTYETAILNHIDKEVKFSYEQYQPILFSRNNFNDNLSAVLSFYAYIILGLDYDSFSSFGGERYLQTAQEILNSIPASAASAYPGWKSVESNRNRFWIIENLLSPRVRPFRQSWYEYHRHGLDKMADDPAGGRAVIAAALDRLPEVNQSYPNSMILQMFTNAKSKEIVEIFKLGTREEKDKVIQAMTRIDATNANEYRAIR